MAMHHFRCRNSEFFGDQPWIDRGMSLSGRLHAERNHEIFAAGEFEQRAFGRHATGMFEEARNPEAAIFSALCGLALSLLEAGIIGKHQSLVENRRKFAAVIR